MILDHLLLLALLCLRHEHLLFPEEILSAWPCGVLPAAAFGCSHRHLLVFLDFYQEEIVQRLVGIR